MERIKHLCKLTAKGKLIIQNQKSKTE